MDHFPPEDVGGKLSVLVCKPCNNIAGSAYESKFAQYIEKECFNKKVPNSKILSSVKISDIRGWHKSNLSIDEKGQFVFRLTTNQTKNLPELAALFPSNVSRRGRCVPLISADQHGKEKYSVSRFKNLERKNLLLYIYV